MPLSNQLETRYYLKRDWSSAYEKPTGHAKRLLRPKGLSNLMVLHSLTEAPESHRA